MWGCSWDLGFGMWAVGLSGNVSWTNEPMKHGERRNWAYFRNNFWRQRKLNVFVPSIPKIQTGTFGNCHKEMTKKWKTNYGMGQDYYFDHFNHPQKCNLFKRYVQSSPFGVKSLKPFLVDPRYIYSIYVVDPASIYLWQYVGYRSNSCKICMKMHSLAILSSKLI
jgi:hypothetical protein